MQLGNNIILIISVQFHKRCSSPTAICRWFPAKIWQIINSSTTLQGTRVCSAYNLPSITSILKLITTLLVESKTLQLIYTIKYDFGHVWYLCEKKMEIIKPKHTIFVLLYDNRVIIYFKYVHFQRYRRA